MKVKFKSNADLEKATLWLSEHVSPLKYYLHDGRIGSTDWRYNAKTYELEVDDGRQLTMLLLKLGSTIDQG